MLDKIFWRQASSTDDKDMVKEKYIYTHKTFVKVRE